MMGHVVAQLFSQNLLTYSTDLIVFTISCFSVGGVVLCFDCHVLTGGAGYCYGAVGLFQRSVIHGAVCDECHVGELNHSSRICRLQFLRIGAVSACAVRSSCVCYNRHLVKLVCPLSVIIDYIQRGVGDVNRTNNTYAISVGFDFLVRRSIPYAHPGVTAQVQRTPNVNAVAARAVVVSSQNLHIQAAIDYVHILQSLDGRLCASTAVGVTCMGNFYIRVIKNQRALCCYNGFKATGAVLLHCQLSVILRGEGGAGGHISYKHCAVIGF